MDPPTPQPAFKAPLMSCQQTLDGPPRPPPAFNPPSNVMPTDLWWVWNRPISQGKHPALQTGPSVAQSLSVCRRVLCLRRWAAHWPDRTALCRWAGWSPLPLCHAGWPCARPSVASQGSPAVQQQNNDIRTGTKSLQCPVCSVPAEEQTGT